MPIYPVDPATQRAVTGQGSDIAAGGPFDALLQLRLKQQEAERELFGMVAKMNPGLASMMLSQNPGLMKSLTATPALSFGGPKKQAPMTGPLAATPESLGQAYEGVSPREGKKAVKQASTAFTPESLSDMLRQAQASMPQETTIPLREGQWADLLGKALESADSQAAQGDPAGFRGYVNDFLTAHTTSDDNQRNAAVERLGSSGFRKIDIRPDLADAMDLHKYLNKYPDAAPLFGLNRPTANLAEALALKRDRDLDRLFAELRIREIEDKLDKGEKLSFEDDQKLAASSAKYQGELTEIEAVLSGNNPVVAMLETEGGGMDPKTLEMLKKLTEITPERRVQLESRKEELTEEIERIAKIRSLKVSRDPNLRGDDALPKPKKDGEGKRRTPQEILDAVTAPKP